VTIMTGYRYGAVGPRGWRTEFERVFLVRAQSARTDERLRFTPATTPSSAANADAEAAPPHGSSQIMTVDGVRVAYLAVGRGDVVALLHSSGSSAAQWRELAALLNDRFALIAPDQFGCGGTGAWSGRQPIRMADHARLAAEVLRKQGRPVHLVGHSFGGAVALRLALNHPHLLRSLTLIEPVAFQLLREGGAEDASLYAEIRTIAAAVFEATLTGHGHAGMQRFVDYWNGDGAWARLSGSTQDRLATQIGGIAANFSCVFADGTRASDYRRITVPTLMLRGSESPRTVARVADRVAAVLPRAEQRTISGAGHMLPLTHAAVVAAAVTEHCEACGGVDVAA
jgi:pimeloyl-ACP methyl ester carboxylesterase